MKDSNESNISKKRSRTDLIADILKIIQDKKAGIKPTHLMYKANLSHSTMKLHLENLKKGRLIDEIEIEEKKGRKKKLIKITRKGIDFSINYQKMKEFEKTFGI